MDSTAEIFQKPFYKEIHSNNTFLNESEMDKNTQTDCFCCDKQNTERLDQEQENVGFRPTESSIKGQLLQPGNTSKNEEENGRIEENASPSDACEKEFDTVLLEERELNKESPEFEILEAESVILKMEAKSLKRGIASMAGLVEDFVDQISIKKTKIAQELVLEEISSLASAKNLEIFKVNESEENSSSAAGDREDAKNVLDFVTNEESLVQSGKEKNKEEVNVLEEISTLAASAKNLEIFNVKESEENSSSAAGENEDAKNVLDIVTNQESLVENGNEENEQDINILEEISSLAASAKNEESNILNCPRDEPIVEDVKDEEGSTIDENEPENEKVDEDKQNGYERSIPNNEFINPARNHFLTCYWQATSHQPFVLHEVTKDTDEFRTVNYIFTPTCRGMQIEKLERIENPYLLAHYLLKKEKMKGGIFGGGVVEKNLFHGTRCQFLESICKSNFDWRRRGTSRGHKFGQGVSFTPEVSYARHYTFGDKVMILTKVLVKNSTVGNHGTVIPPKGFDTTSNIPETVIVKYEDDDFLPQYVIHYKY